MSMHLLGHIYLFELVLKPDRLMVYHPDHYHLEWLPEQMCWDVYYRGTEVEFQQSSSLPMFELVP